jgi:trimethylamine--corrinoid protein Co-methyltransferase
MNRLAVLADDELSSIHDATLRILSEVGIVLTHPEAREILKAAGASTHGDRVLLPSDLVEREVARCPHRVLVRGRDGGTVTIGDGNLHWHNLGGARDVYDFRTGQRRAANVQDLCNSSRLLDAMDSITTVTPLFTPCDVPGELMSVAMYRHCLPHTTKPVQGPGVQRAAEVRCIARMAAVIGPPEEVLTIAISPVSPLHFPDDVAEAMIETARLGIPFGALPCPIAGATAPMSLAGALAQQNAEVLASIVMTQLIHPSLPTIYYGRLSLVEPRTGVSTWGGAVMSLVCAATVQIGHRYGLPVNVYGLCTNSHVMDLQSGYERTINAVVPALAGADELSGIGEIEAGVVSSLAQIVTDNEIAAGVSRLRRGISVNDDSLGVDVIATVMDGSRNFMSHRHTARHLRSGELLLPNLAYWRTWEEWEQAGREGMIERAQAEAERLLAEHKVPPLTENQEQELEEIMRQTREELP